MEHTKHIWRAILLIVFLAAAAIIARHFLIPESFGEYGYFRGDSLTEFMSLPVIHGGAESCKACHEHEDEYDEKAGGQHAAVQCEVCHAPLARHVRNDAKFADMPTNRSYRLCALCHQKLRARPADMPQVEIRKHLIETKALEPGAPIPERACLDCHEAHNPTGE